LDEFAGDDHDHGGNDRDEYAKIESLITSHRVAFTGAKP
jgi:hypothetical protein